MITESGKCLRFFRQRVKELLAEKGRNRHDAHEERLGGRAWEDYYRRRWQHDKVVRSTHGVNCTGSCSFDVFVKDGIIVWEAQKTDYPTPHPDFPDYEPRGCPRGLSASWYVYSPLRVRHPLLRGELLRLWREAKEAHPDDPVAAWKAIQNDPAKRSAYQKARGKGGFERIHWDEALEMLAASLVHTIETHGPDRIFGFTPLPAMSMTSFASGSRLLTMLGASMVSFYDWYCDLPPASPQIWGEQTDVPESADWYNAGYLLVWGSNLPQTRTPDAHFFTEARYRGTTVAAVSPDYADFTKFAEHWLPAKAGTDAALATAMTHVILKENYVDRRVPGFEKYAKTVTDLPFLLLLDEENGVIQPGRFLRASDLQQDVPSAQWQCMVYDQKRKAPATPHGSMGSRYGADGLWNLDMRDVTDKTDLAPALSLGDVENSAEVVWVDAQFPSFDHGIAAMRTVPVPTLRLNIKNADGTSSERLVCTVFDSLAASLGVDRGHGGEVASSYDDAAVYGSPAWQEAITSVPRADMIRVARDFAANAERTGGRSMIVMGAGINHWYHNDTIYRSILSMVLLCGCQGVSGGGWAHYVGQEKVRPQAGWATLTMGSDWMGPPRLHNGTSFYYFALDAWRYELLDMHRLCVPGTNRSMPAHPADCNALAARLGWLPFYPQFGENSIETCRKAMAAGADTDEAIVKHTVERLKSGDLPLAVDNPDAEVNVPRVMLFWRANPLGSNVKGHEYFLKYLLGTEDALLSQPSSRTPEQVSGPEMDSGKLDLMVTTEIRMSTSCLYSDLVLPAAHWYEYDDLSSTDMHPFVHPFNAAAAPAWEAKDNWDQFQELARVFSKLAGERLGTVKDMVAMPLLHDTPGELAQALGEVHDWRTGEVEAVPGKTMFNLKVVERPYADLYNMYRTLGPHVTKPGGVGSKGVSWSCEPEYEELKSRLGVLDEPGVGHGRPLIDTGKKACEVVLALSPETNGAVGVRSWAGVERQTGRELSQMSKPVEDICMTFADVSAQPRQTFPSPIWSGIEGRNKTYSAFDMNLQYGIPFRTLTGRQHFYLDHQWMREFGEALPVFRPTPGLDALGEVGGKVPRSDKELVLNFLSPHSKWSIHSSYSDNHIMRSLSRGGGEIWLNHEDAAQAGITDNMWLECCNVNGVFMGRAIVTHRIPRGKTFIYHAQERHVHVPLSPTSGTRAGTHNSLTRPLVKPTQMIGGYAQLSYGFNYYGPTGCQRDEFVVVRKAGEVRFDED